MKEKRLQSIHLAVLLAVIFFIGGCVSLPLWQIQPLKETTVTGRGRDKVLLIDISGIITGKDKKSFTGITTQLSHPARIKEELEKAQKDKRIKALILRIDTPGGTVTASDIIHREIIKFKEKKNIPVIACLMNIATSGGYYIANAADTIIAHPTTITGSIGVIAVKFNIKGLMQKVGVEEESIKSGDKKDILSPFRPSTKEEIEIIQKIIDSLYERFIGVIEQGRKNLTREEIRRLADGRIFTAQQARDARLIDRIGYLEDALDVVKQKLGVKKIRLVMYHRPRAYKNNIYSQATVNLFNLDGNGLYEYLPVRFMYLWNP